MDANAALHARGPFFTPEAGPKDNGSCSRHFAAATFYRLPTFFADLSLLSSAFTQEHLLKD